MHWIGWCYLLGVLGEASESLNTLKLIFTESCFSRRTCSSSKRAKRVLHPCSSEWLCADINLGLQHLHAYFLHLWWECFVLNVAMKISHCDVHFVHLSLWWGAFLSRCLLCDMVIYALMFLVCQFRWEVDFSGLWLLYFCINAVLKTYLLDLYSYRRYFIFISLKGKRKIIVLHVLFDCAVPDLTCLSLFYLIQPEGEVYLLFFFACVLTTCLKLNFNPAPYVLMPRWRVWFVPVVQRKSLFLRVPVTTFC